jgi:hypothetical protein
MNGVVFYLLQGGGGRATRGGAMPPIGFIGELPGVRLAVWTVPFSCCPQRRMANVEVDLQNILARAMMTRADSVARRLFYKRLAALPLPPEHSISMLWVPAATEQAALADNLVWHLFVQACHGHAAVMVDVLSNHLPRRGQMYVIPHVRVWWERHA